MACTTACSEMTKLAKELTAIEVARIWTEGAHAVGSVSGLYLQVIGRSRTWILRFTLGARRRRMGLGAFPSVTLAQAREKARAARAALDEGRDPIEQREKSQREESAARARVVTFRVASERFIEMRESEWKNAKHRQQWENTLRAYAWPSLGSVDVSLVDRDMVLQVLRPIWRDKTETASRLRGRLEQILDWASAHGHRAGENPARWRGHLDQLLPRPSKIAAVVHHEAVSLADAPEVVARIAAAPGMGAAALLLQIFTAARSGEVRGALWGEIDLVEKVWAVPAERMKGNRPHRVPLSRQAVELIEGLPKYEGTDLVFPSNRNTPLSDMTLTAVLRRMKIAAVPHGFRSTFRDWAAEHTHYPRDVAEMALAHAIGSKVEAAYRRGDMLAKRAPMMQEWADFCLPSPPG